MDISNESSQATPKPTSDNAAPPPLPAGVPEEAADLLSALKPKQVIVIRAVWRGLNFVDAAQEGNVGRNTVYRWRKLDPNFRAAVNGWQHEQIGSALSILTAALPAAAKRFAQYAECYPDAALKLLDRFKVFAPAGGTTAEACAHEIQIEQSKEQADFDEQLSDIKDQQARIRAKEVQRCLKLNNTPAPEPALATDDPLEASFPKLDTESLLKTLVAEWKKEADEREAAGENDDLEEDEDADEDE